MKVNVSIEDSVFEEYVKRFGIPKCYQIMKKAITLFKDVDEADRYVFLAGDDRRAVEAIFETTIDSGTQLAKMCNRLNTVKIGDASVAFTTEELERLTMQATFHGKDMTTFVHDLAIEIKRQILELY